MSSSVSSISGYRYERKFAIPGLTMLEAEAFIRLLPGMFSEIYYPRMVNNIYLDSLQSQCYFDNLDGLKDRVKVRVRWYNNLLGLIEKPILEFKIRKGSLGKKISYTLKPFLFDQTFRYEILRDIFNISDVQESVKMQLSDLQPSLVNRYERKYFQSGDRKIRITVDTDLAYYYINPHYNSFLNSMNDQAGIIVELKYDGEENGYVNSLLKSLPFRMTRSSKYVMGKEKISLA